MSRLAFLMAPVAFFASISPGLGMYLGMAFGILACVAGFLAYRRHEAAPWSRLAGAFGLTVGLVALLLAGGRFGVTWWAVERLNSLLA